MIITIKITTTQQLSFTTALDMNYHSELLRLCAECSVLQKKTYLIFNNDFKVMKIATALKKEGSLGEFLLKKIAREWF